ncbi:hypothetical protein Acy02nite_06510 [Actinoplanes cyaneus]|uniref:NTP pyrophosphohydrolase n=1 Tax=Actinoplanes cyaneus TaxID=52696 RepID=A0A919IIX5_9ACTN|nr:hypothetical protein [Actinoplanes cyaneus]GID62770.1 hypothetical protein Acy02nite_06510 [Actinoplanes cyaneus]
MSDPLTPAFREPAFPEAVPTSPESPFQVATSQAAVSGEPESPPLIVVDGANVVGSVPDGWWRDRAGAAVRLRDRLAALPATGLGGIPAPVEVILVVEGKARDIPQGPPGVRIERASGSGDDKIIELVRGEPRPRRIVVVTADRGLRDRAVALGAEILGPSAVPR